MQLKFLTLGFISAALFSNAVFAHDGSLVNVEDTNIEITKLVSDVLNNLNAHGLLEHANLDVLSHIADKKGDARLDRRRLHDALRRREWERDEDENEPDEEEEDEDEDENEPDEEEEDEDEADESSVAKVVRRSVEEEDLDATPEDDEEESNDDECDDEEEEDSYEDDEEEEESNEDEEEESNEDEEQDEGEEQDQDEVRMARRSTPGAQTDSTDQTTGGDGVSGIVEMATNALGGVSSLP